MIIAWSAAVGMVRWRGSVAGEKEKEKNVK